MEKCSVVKNDSTFIDLVIKKYFLENDVTKNEEIVKLVQSLYKKIVRKKEVANIDGKSKFELKKSIACDDPIELRKALKIFETLGMEVKIKDLNEKISYYVLDKKDYNIYEITNLDQRIYSVLQNYKNNEKSKKRICAAVKLVLSKAHQEKEISPYLKNKDRFLFKETLACLDYLTVNEINITALEITIKGRAKPENQSSNT